MNISTLHDQKILSSLLKHLHFKHFQKLKMHSFKQQPCVDLQNLTMATLDVLKNGMVSVCIQQCPPPSMKCL
jgi:hypothetical protein